MTFVLVHHAEEALLHTSDTAHCMATADSKYLPRCLHLLYPACFHYKYRECYAEFSCDSYLTIEHDANKVITKGIWGGVVLGKDGKPVQDASFECSWVDIFGVESGRIANVESFFDTAAIQKAFGAAKVASA